jgi:hypothetical protein
LTAVLVAVALSAPSGADRCWSEADMDATKIRDLQSRLMVATLRCQGAGVDVTGAYNHFVIANRATLQGINAVLMSRFRSDVSDAEAQVQYDRYATALANAYGGDTTNRRVCDNTARLPRKPPGPKAMSGAWSRSQPDGMPPPRPARRAGDDRCWRQGARIFPPVEGSRPADAAHPSGEGRGLGWLVIDE